MNLEGFILRAFENIAAYITNLDSLRSLITEILSKVQTLDDFVNSLRTHSESADITLITDIRILINEIESLSRERKAEE